MRGSGQLPSGAVCMFCACQVQRRPLTRIRTDAVAASRRPRMAGVLGGARSDLLRPLQIFPDDKRPRYEV